MLEESYSLSAQALQSQYSNSNTPKMTLQQFRIHIILSLGARYDFIFNNSGVVSWRS